MNSKKIRENCLIWLLKCLEEQKNENVPSVKGLNEEIRDGLENMSFNEYLIKKMFIRDIYLKCRVGNFREDWISKKIFIANKHIFSDSCDDTYYERTASSTLERKFIIDFENNFICNKIEDSQYKLFFTSSGMSAILLALHLCQMLSKSKRIIVQNDMYYEIEPVLKTIFNYVEYCNVEQIYQLLLKSDVVCYFLGYARKSESTNILSIQRLIDVLSRTENNKPIFVIVDRTYFSLVDKFYDQLGRLVNKENITIISVESLLKHYQYGLEMTTLGAMLVYSKKCKSRIYAEMISLLYISLGVRLSPVLYSRLFAFDKAVLTDMFMLACHNAECLYKYLQDETVIKIGYGDGPNLKGGDLLYISVASVQQCKEIISFIQKDRKVLHGQSFGLDITRVCCEENKKRHDVKLRISLGTEDEESIENLGESIKNALQKCRSL